MKSKSCRWDYYYAPGVHLLRTMIYKTPRIFFENLPSPCVNFEPVVQELSTSAWGGWDWIQWCLCVVCLIQYTMCGPGPYCCTVCHTHTPISCRAIVLYKAKPSCLEWQEAVQLEMLLSCGSSSSTEGGSTVSGVLIGLFPVLNLGCCPAIPGHCCLLARPCLWAVGMSWLRSFVWGKKNSFIVLFLFLLPWVEMDFVLLP